MAGDRYAISYYLKNGSGPANDFEGFFGGQEFDPILDANIFPYTQFMVTETAASNATVLQFAGRQVPSTFVLSDISVTDLGPSATVPEPSSFVLLGLGVPLGLIVRRRIRK